MSNSQIKTKEQDISERFRISTHTYIYIYISVLFYPEIRRCISLFFLFLAVCFFLLYSGFIRMIEREKRWRISILRWYWPSHISSIEHLSWLNDKKRWRKRNLISLEFRFVLFVHPSSIFISYLRLKATEWNIHRVRMYICAFICTPKCECVCFFSLSFV